MAEVDMKSLGRRCGKCIWEGEKKHTACRHSAFERSISELMRNEEWEAAGGEWSTSC